MKHLLKMSDLSPAELHHILDVAEELKAEQKAGTTPALLKGRSVALMFSKNSTRTRTSFEVGVYQLGGLGNYMNAATELQSGRGEPLKDTARVLGRYYDCVVWRTYRQCDLEEFAELAGVPVINGLTDYAHPCQVLADLMTIRERRGTLEGQKLCFIGDGCSMANSLIVGGLLAGMRVTCVCPEGYRPAADVLMFAHKYGEKFHLLTDPAEGVKDADVVVTAFAASDLARELDALEKVADSMHAVSDAMTELLGTTALDMDQKMDESRLQLKLAAAEARDNAAKLSPRDAAAALRAKADEAMEAARKSSQEARLNASEAATAVKLAAKGTAERTAELLRLEQLAEELQARSEEMRARTRSSKYFGKGRMLRAYPKLRHGEKHRSLDELRERLKYERRHWP